MRQCEQTISILKFNEILSLARAFSHFNQNILQIYFFPPRRRFFFLLKHNIIVVVQCVVRFVMLCLFFAVIANFFLFFSCCCRSTSVKTNITTHNKPSRAKSNRSEVARVKITESKIETEPEREKNSNHRNKELESMISFRFSISNPMTEVKCEKSAAKKSKSANMKDFLLRLCAKWRHMNSYPKYFLEQTMPRAASSSNSMRYYTSLTVLRAEYKYLKLKICFHLVLLIVSMSTLMPSDRSHQHRA